MLELQAPLLLASQSPRRRELLKMLDIPFTIVDTDFTEEAPDTKMNSEDLPEYFAVQKGEEVKQAYPHNIIITADTLVLLEGKALGKPKSYAEAEAQLTSLSGKAHKVITGVSLTLGPLRKSWSIRTDVYFSELSALEVAYYINQHHPYDKAGGYGVQDWLGAIGIGRIEGCFYNVMGLPLHDLYNNLKSFSVRAY